MVAQADPFSSSHINTVVVAAVSSNLGLADAPGNFVLAAGKRRLAKPSVVNVSQLLTLDKRFLESKIGRLSSRELGALDAGLRKILSL